MDEVRKIREDVTFIPEWISYARGREISPSRQLEMFEPALVMAPVDDNGILPRPPTIGTMNGRNEPNFYAVNKKPCRLEAHGVERQKGGLLNLLDIMIEGLLYAKWHGPMGMGMPDFFAGPHGPYYIFIDLETDEKNDISNGNSDAIPDIKRLQRHIYSSNRQLAYLIPDRYKETLTEKLHLAQAQGLITLKEKEELINKILTYSDYLLLPEGEDGPLNSIAAFKKYFQH
ncbi:MAG: hypothetical protein HQK53_16980 [Oligoflexia bacterium]|nr:hypothetical protein [Oligoflexia bacterium]